jgi:hypothetical protein
MKVPTRWYRALKKYAPKLLEEIVKKHQFIKKNKIFKDGTTDATEQVRMRVALAREIIKKRMHKKAEN